MGADAWAAGRAVMWTAAGCAATAMAAPGAARAGAAADKDGWAMRQEQEVNRAVERYADTVGGCAWSI